MTSPCLRRGPNCTSTVLARSTGHFSGPTLSCSRSRSASASPRDWRKSAAAPPSSSATISWQGRSTIMKSWTNNSLGPPPTMFARQGAVRLGPKVPGLTGLGLVVAALHKMGEDAALPPPKWSTRTRCLPFPLPQPARAPWRRPSSHCENWPARWLTSCLRRPTREPGQ